MKKEEIYMIEAIKMGIRAYKHNEVPVGAIIVKNGKILAKSRNNRQKDANPLGHAEVNVIRKAAKKIKDWRLDNCELYVTLKPCSMCEAVIKSTRIKKVHYCLENNNMQNSVIEYIQTNVRSTVFELYMQKYNDFFQKLRK